MRKWLGAGVLLALGAAAAGAADWKALKPRGYVSDFAEVVDAATKARLETYCADVERSTGATLALVTVASLEGETIEDAAGAIFRNWGLGDKQGNRGIMLLLAVGEGRYRLEAGKGLVPILPGGLADDVLREMRPAVRRRQFGEALMAAAQTIGEAIARARKVSIAERLPRTVRPTLFNSIPWPLVLGGVFLLLWLLRAGGARGYVGGVGAGLLPGLLSGNGIARSTWGARGSGGFGGYDSSDGFGGFGGGDSGGGGASTDW